MKIMSIATIVLFSASLLFYKLAEIKVAENEARVFFLDGTNQNKIINDKSLSPLKFNNKAVVNLHAIEMQRLIEMGGGSFKRRSNYIPPPILEKGEVNLSLLDKCGIPRNEAAFIKTCLDLKFDSINQYICDNIELVQTSENTQDTTYYFALDANEDLHNQAFGKINQIFEARYGKEKSAILLKSISKYDELCGNALYDADIKLIKNKDGRFTVMAHCYDPLTTSGHRILLAHDKDNLKTILGTALDPYLK